MHVLRVSSCAENLEMCCHIFKCVYVYIDIYLNMNMCFFGIGGAGAGGAGAGGSEIVISHMYMCT